MGTRKNVLTATAYAASVSESKKELHQFKKDAESLEELRGDHALLLQQSYSVLNSLYPHINLLTNYLLAPDHQSEELSGFRACFLLGQEIMRQLKKAAEILNEHNQNDQVILFQGQLLIVNEALNHFERLLIGEEESTRFNLSIEECLRLAKTLTTPTLLDSRFPDLLFEVGLVINQLTDHMKKLTEQFPASEDSDEAKIQQIHQSYQQCEDCWKIISNIEAMKGEKPLRHALNESLKTLESHRHAIRDLLSSKKLGKKKENYE